MILSASRRTDLPAFYSEWFFRRLREGYACVRNPRNPRQVSRIPLSPDVVDGIVFWTKDPRPMLGRLGELREYPYYFQFTLSPYGSDLEPGLPSKREVLLPAFRELARRLGPERVVWRYDPILLSRRYSLQAHGELFGEFARYLRGSTQKCVISFLDFYRNTEKNLRGQGLLPLGGEEMLELGARLSEAARENGMSLEACSEPLDLSALGIGRARCIDAELLSRISGRRLEAPKDKNQRRGCGCAESVDLGAYDTCRHGCLYCYANHSRKLLSEMVHDPSSSLLSGHIGPLDTVTDRAFQSFEAAQQSLF